MSTNVAGPTSPYSLYATPPTTPSPSHLASLTSAAETASTSTGPARHPRRVPFNPSRPIPTLRREKSLFGEDSKLGSMVLSSVGFDRIGHVCLGGDNQAEEFTSSQLEEIGVRSGWMVTNVGEDNGSQFTQGSAHSLLFDSQPSQPTIGMATLDPYQLPSAPILRTRGRDPCLASPSQRVSQRGLSRRNPAALSRNPPRRRAFGREPLGREGTGAGLEGISDGDEE